MKLSKTCSATNTCNISMNPDTILASKDDPEWVRLDEIVDEAIDELTGYYAFDIDKQIDQVGEDYSITIDILDDAGEILIPYYIDPELTPDFYDMDDEEAVEWLVQDVVDAYESEYGIYEFD